MRSRAEEDRKNRDAKKHLAGEVILMRPELQAMCHLKYRRKNAVNDEPNQNCDYHDNKWRNQLRDHRNRTVKFAFINIRDGLHRLGKVSRLFSYRHHVGKQIWK